MLVAFQITERNFLQTEKITLFNQYQTKGNTTVPMQNIYLLIPVYNEAKYLKQFIDKLAIESEKNNEIEKIVFINDGSKDSTRVIVEEFMSANPKVELLNHKNNQGKGAAMKTGLEYARKLKADAVIFMDGDCQHDPKYLKNFIISLTHSPIVFGYRELPKGTPWWRKYGNQVAGFIIKLGFKITKKDLLCGYMALRKDSFSEVYWNEKGYGVETEIAVVVGKKNLPFTENFIDTVYLDPTKGVNLFHAFLILLKIPIWYFR